MAKSLFHSRGVLVSAVALGFLAFGLVAAQPASAADLGPGIVPVTVDEQTVPEPADPNPGGIPGEGAVPGDEGAVPDDLAADGGSATPWVLVGIVALLIAALGAAMWASRKPRHMDIEHDRHTSTTDGRYIPPGL